MGTRDARSSRERRREDIRGGRWRSTLADPKKCAVMDRWCVPIEDSTCFPTTIEALIDPSLYSTPTLRVKVKRKFLERERSVELIVNKVGASMNPKWKLAGANSIIGIQMMWLESRGRWSMGAQKQNFIIEWGLVIFDVAHVFPPHLWCGICRDFSSLSSGVAAEKRRRTCQGFGDNGTTNTWNPPLNNGIYWALTKNYTQTLCLWVGKRVRNVGFWLEFPKRFWGPKTHCYLFSSFYHRRILTSRHGSIDV